MRVFLPAALAAIALVCLPLVLHAQPHEVGGQLGTLIDAARANDCQVELAAALGLLAWALRRSLQPESFVHTNAGAVLVTGACAAIGAIVPALQAHAFSAGALVSAVTSGVVAALALSNPAAAKRDALRPPDTLLLLVGVGLALGTSGCADPIRQSATATLRTATAAVRTFETFDHGHKRTLAASIVKACTPAPVGPERDACVERELAPLRSYLAARKPVLDALDGMEVSAGLVGALVDLDGPAPPELATLAEKLGAAVTQVIALITKLRGAP